MDEKASAACHMLWTSRAQVKGMVWGTGILPQGGLTPGTGLAVFRLQRGWDRGKKVSGRPQVSTQGTGPTPIIRARDVVKADVVKADVVKAESQLTHP